MAHPVSFRGRVVGGLGKAAGFTQLPWARSAFRARLGVDPWPGTLNLLGEVGVIDAWLGSLGQPEILQPPDASQCAALCWPVRIAERFPGAVLRPDISGYPGHQLEVIASLPLRERLGLSEGDQVLLTPARLDGVDAVLFDVDGTLVNSIDGMWLAASRAAALFGFQVPADAVRRSLNSNEPLWPAIIPPEAASNPELPRLLRREMLRHWNQVLRESVSVLPGIPELLAALRESGRRLGIYTGSRGESFLPLEAAGLMPLFDVVLTANDVLRPKPDPDGLLRCLRTLALSPERVLYVGDSQHDVQAGRAAGMRAVGVLTGAADAVSLAAAGADRILADASALHAALDLSG